MGTSATGSKSFNELLSTLYTRRVEALRINTEFLLSHPHEPADVCDEADALKEEEDDDEDDVAVEGDDEEHLLQDDPHDLCARSDALAQHEHLVRRRP